EEPHRHLAVGQGQAHVEDRPFFCYCVRHIRLRPSLCCREGVAAYFARRFAVVNPSKTRKSNKSGRYTSEARRTRFACGTELSLPNARQLLKKPAPSISAATT